MKPRQEDISEGRRKEKKKGKKEGKMKERREILKGRRTERWKKGKQKRMSGSMKEGRTDGRKGKASCRSVFQTRRADLRAELRRGNESRGPRGDAIM